MEQTLITDAFESTSFTTEISNNVAINNNEDNTCDVEVKTDVDSGNDDADDCDSCDENEFS